MIPLGRRRWAIPGGNIPPDSTGPEPRWTSFDELCVLNAGDGEASVAITIYYEDREPVGPYKIRIAGRRVRQLRLNDLIDPEAIPLGTAYACVVESSVPVVVQFVRQDTGRAENAALGLMGYPDDGTG